MKKQQVVNKLEQAWMSFKESYTGLTDVQLMENGVLGEWSVKDILAHVNIWEEEALKYLPYILEGKATPRYSTLYGGIDAFNAKMVAGRRNLGLNEIRTRLEDTHRRLVEYVQGAPEEQFTLETRFRRRLRLDTYSHYPEHTRAIREWRERST